MTILQIPKNVLRCPYEKTISIIGSAWNLMVIKTLYLNNAEMRFNELLKSLKPISSKTLSAKLKELAEVEIINRNVIPESPVRITYELTEKGRDLNEILDSMAAWSLKWNMEELT